jgi:hypothetical protein
MSTSEGVNTGRSGDSRSHHWHLVDNGNVAYHLTHNALADLEIPEVTNGASSSTGTSLPADLEIPEVTNGVSSSTGTSLTT